MDSDSESEDECRNVARRLEGDEQNLQDVPSSPPSEVIRELEADLCCHPRASRRVVLAPQSLGGTPQSVHDRDPGSLTGGHVELSVPSVHVPSTIPASSGAVRRLVLINSQDVRTPVVDMTMLDTESVTDSENSAPSPQSSPRIENGSPQPSEFGPDSDAGESDTDSLPGTDAVQEESVEESVVDFAVQQRAIRAVFQLLDECELSTVFETRAQTMKTVPFILRGAFRAAVRTSLEEIMSGWDHRDEVKQERGWKLFFLLPRMLLSRPCRGGLVSRKKLETRFQKFFAGDWLDLMSDAESVSRQASSARIWKRRRPRTDGSAARAEKLTMMGELSAARQALESAGLAPGDKNTLNVLRNPARRPAAPREPLPPEMRTMTPAREFDLDDDTFCRNLRSARRGAAPGPSGMTCEHLQPLLESDRDSALLCQVSNLLARGHVPPTVLQVLRLGRVTALKKADGGVRGIVVSDVLRRLVARTIAKQCASSAEKATAPFQYALRTRAGCECVSHVFQTLTDLDPSATILSVDGVGAFDLVSHNAMMEGLLGMEGGDQILPFVRLFYGSPSTFFWEDTTGGVHHIFQGEGGEQGDPLMPMLFSLGQHAALVAISERLEDGERLLAFLDDLYVVSTPERTVAVHNILREELWQHAKISVHNGKTRVWNRGGIVPDRCDVLEAAARAVDPSARVWRGNHEDRPEEQGITILGTPVGRQEFVERELAKIITDHSELLTRIPEVQDLQCAWLLLLYCGAARANFYIRTIRPELTANFARSHDDQIWQCFCNLLRIRPDAVAASAKAGHL